MQKNGAGLHASLSCHWDTVTDGTIAAADLRYLNFWSLTMRNVSRSTRCQMAKRQEQRAQPIDVLRRHSRRAQFLAEVNPQSSTHADMVLRVFHPSCASLFSVLLEIATAGAGDSTTAGSRVAGRWLSSGIRLCGWRGIICTMTLNPVALAQSWWPARPSSFIEDSRLPSKWPPFENTSKSFSFAKRLGQRRAIAVLSCRNFRCVYV